MKQLFLIIFFLVCIFRIPSIAQTLPANQNLVPNGSFEFIRDGRDFDTTLVNNDYCWSRATKQGPSIFSAKHDVYFKRAVTGDMFCRLTLGYNYYDLNTNQWMLDTTDPETRNYIETKLLEPLAAGVKYYFTFHVGHNKFQSPTMAGGDMVANLGVHFSDTFVYQRDTRGRLNLHPQIRFTNWSTPPLYDTVIYTKLTAEYVAKGGEEYMIIGNFDYYAQLEFLYITPLSIANGRTVSYFGLLGFDDVSLVRDTSLPLISNDYFELGNDTVLCPGQNITLGGQAGFPQYHWNTGATTRTITASLPGKYWCTVDGGCAPYTDTIKILPLVPASAFDLPDTALCPGIAYLSQAPAGYPKYLWSTGSTAATIRDSLPGLYWARITDHCGGTFTDTFRINNKDIPLSPFNIGDTLFCGTGLALGVPNQYPHYLWSNGSSTYNTVLNGPGKYWLQVSNDCQSIFTDSFEVRLAKPFDFDIEDAASCRIDLWPSVPEGYKQYLWSNGSATNTTHITAAGKHWVKVTNECDRSFTDSFTLRSLDTYLANPGLPGQVANCLYGRLSDLPLQITKAQPTDKIRWSTGAVTESITVREPGTYWVEISNECSLLADTITLSGCPPVEIGFIWLPSAFSPNGDGLNDVFRIPHPPAGIVEIELAIFSRFGNLLKKITDISDGWDGGVCDLGTYFYYLKYKDITGKEHFQKGDVTLVR